MSSTDMIVKHQLDEATVPAAEDNRAPLKPTRQDLHRLAQAEITWAGVELTPDVCKFAVNMVIDLFVRAMDEATSNGDAKAEVHVQRAYQYRNVHRALDVLVPDDVDESPTGSFKAGLEGFLGSDGQPVTVGHTKSELFNEGDNCVVTVSTTSVRMN